MRLPTFRKSFEFFNGMFDFGAGALRSGFYPVQQGGLSAPPVNLARTSTGSEITPKMAIQLSAAWSCVWLIADSISTLPFILNQREGTNSWGEPATSNPTFDVVGRRPNSMMTAPDFWQFMIASELLWGNAYAEIVRNGAGDCVALLPLLPQYMVPYKILDTGELRYRYVPTGQMSDPQEDYAAVQIFHMKDRSLDGMVGLSRIEFARNSLGLAAAAEQASADTFKNGMRTNGFLMYDKVLKDEQRKAIKQSLNNFRAGGPDSSGFMVLEGGMTLQALNIMPMDAQLLSSRQFAVEDICRWFGVPPVMIGHAAAGVTSWGTGIEQLLLGFQSLTLRPCIRRIEAAVAQKLLSTTSSKSMYLKIDANDLLGADSISRSQLNSTNAQNGIMTRNEIRAGENLPPLPGGDVLTIQSNLVPAEKLGETPPGQTPPGFGVPPGKTPPPGNEPPANSPPGKDRPNLHATLTPANLGAAA